MFILKSGEKEIIEAFRSITPLTSIPNPLDLTVIY